MTHICMNLSSLAYTLVAVRRPAGLPLMVVEQLPETHRWYRVRIGILQNATASDRIYLMDQLIALKELTAQLMGPYTVYASPSKDDHMRSNPFDVVIYVRDEPDVVILKAITADHFAQNPLTNFSVSVSNV